MSYQTSLQRRTATIRIVTIYALFGFGWIYGSDTVLGWLVHDPATMVKIALIKGSLYIICTTVLLYSLINRFIKQITTERKQAETTLEKSEAKFATAFKAIPEALAITSMEDGKYLEVNDAFLEISGLQREEIIGHTSVELGFWLDLNQRQQFLEMLSFNGSLNNYEVKYRVKNDEVRDFMVSSEIIEIEGKQCSLNFIKDFTERKQSETALRERENRLSSIFNYSPVAIGLGEAFSGKMVEVNDAWLRLFGYERDEVIGRTTKELSIYVNTEQRDTIIGIVKDQGRIVNYPIQLRHKTGSVLDIQFSAELITLDAILYLQVLMTDVTDIKLAEQALKQSEYFFKESQRAASIGSYHADFIADKWKSSEVLDVIFGIDDDYVRSIQGWLDIVHPDDRNLMDRYLMEEVMSNRKPFSMEYRIIRKNDGEIRWVNGRGTAEFDNDGNMLSLTGTIQDITERKLAETELLLREQALANSERFLKTIIDSEPECIKMLDIDCNLLMMNRAGLEMIDADSFEQVKGQCVCPLITDQYRDAFVALTKQAFQGISGTLEFETIGLKGRHVWLETHAVPFRDERGEIVALLGITRDITERKRLEEEKDVLEQQFQQAQKMESLGVLAGGIAHDFNNLLAVIIGRCSLAKLRPLTAVDNIPQIETAAERAAALCQQMLAYAGKAKTTKSQIHLEGLVDEMVNMSKATINQNVKITCDLASDIPPIIADASQIRQVTMNLIINAAEAIGESQGEVKVSLAKKTISANLQEQDFFGVIIPPGTYVCLEVTDNGCGMNAETQRRLFEPFYTTKFTGRGLGMSAVLGIIKSHNGALQLRSQPAKGTTFKVYLPIQLTESAECQPQQHAISPTVWKGNGTILLVEDEEQVISVAEVILEELGFTVIKAYNGKEGLELFQQNATSITLVVTDIGMPVMDGYALTRELKKLKPELPIIISSGFGEVDIASQIPGGVTAGIIYKPYSFEQLLEVLKGVVDGPKLTQI